MSLEAWKKVAYPIPACDVPVAQAAAHSLNKWENLRLPVLKEHNLRVAVSGRALIDESGDTFDLTSATCALCHYHVKHWCETCPLREVLGEQCDAGNGSPYCVWVYRGDPEPMIKAMKKVVETQGQA